MAQGIARECRNKSCRLTVRGECFHLCYFHFHSPSEHTVDGRVEPMELHLVHENDAGELAVVGVFLEEGPANAAVQEIWDHIPVMNDGEDVVSIDLAELLPADLAYVRYAGSLTTPPCSEGVRWHVLHEPVTVSRDQIETFRRFYPFNARPLQLLHGRPVLMPEDRN